MNCNKNCRQGRDCYCSEPKPLIDFVKWWWAVAWFLTMMLCGILLWTLVNTAHAKADGYKQSVRCLAEAIYREARGETYRGQLAVAQTVINRTKVGVFSGQICRVVFQRGQFSWTKGWDKSWSADRDSIQVARVALMGTHSMKDFKALYFHNTSVNPGWKRKKIAHIGNHVFYS